MMLSSVTPFGKDLEFLLVASTLALCPCEHPVDAFLIKDY